MTPTTAGLVCLAGAAADALAYALGLCRHSYMVYARAARGPACAPAPPRDWRGDPLAPPPSTWGEWEWLLTLGHAGECGILVFVCLPWRANRLRTWGPTAPTCPARRLCLEGGDV